MRLVDDLLDVSRITRGKIELQREVGRPRDRRSRSAVETSRPRHRRRRTIRSSVASAARAAAGCTAIPCGLPRCSPTCSTTRPSTPNRRAHPSRASTREGDAAVIRVKRQRHRHRRAGAAARVRSVRAGRRTASDAARAGSASASRWCAPSSSCTAARVRGAQRGPGSRQRVRGPAAGARSGRGDAGRGMQPTGSSGSQAPHESSSSTTIRTGPQSLAMLLRDAGQRSAHGVRRAAGRRSRHAVPPGRRAARYRPADHQRL